MTAFEANADVLKIEIVTKRLLHEERKQKGRAESADTNSMEKVMTSEQRIRRKEVRCHYCKRIGHFKCDCFELAADRKAESEKNSRQSANKAKVKRNRRDSSSSESESVGLVTRHALSTTIVNQKES